MNKKIIFLLISLSFGVLFFIFTLIVKSNALIHFDFNTTVKLQNHTPLRLDGIFSTFSYLASAEVLGVILAIVILITKRWKGLIVLFIFAASHSVELVGKTFLRQPGPPFMFHRTYASNITKVFFEGNYTLPGSSYPSGHSMRTLFVAIVFGYLIYSSKKLHKNVKIILSLIILGIIPVVLYSRISLGEHWTTDVIGGTLFGIMMGFISLLAL